MARIDAFLKLGLAQGCSDVHLSVGVPPMLRMNGDLMPIKFRELSDTELETYVLEILTKNQKERLLEGHDLDFSYVAEEGGRFRVNVFRKVTGYGAVFRHIPDDVPTLEQLDVPKILNDFCDYHQGMVLVTGSTGTGKSTTLAAMINHLNEARSLNIISLEDPIEFVFRHSKSIVSQREVGIDTLSYENALREALREAPEVIMIGEARDSDTMKAAINFADTGHLCLTTLHAVNSNQAMDRIMNMFGTDMREQLLMDLSLNLKAVISQRLVPGMQGKLACAVEIMMNSPYISELLREGNFNEIKGIMEKGDTAGMQTFDQSLYRLYKSDAITIKNALAYADSSTNLEWKINFGSQQSQHDASRNLDEQGSELED